MNLEKLIESHYAPKKGNDLLVKLIESKMNEAYPHDPRDFKGPQLVLSKEIGKSLQNPETGKINYNRQMIDMVADNLKKLCGKNGETLENRIKSYQQFFNSGGVVAGQTPQYDISSLMSISMISDVFYRLIHEYDATYAGDLFEPLFAGLFGGTIVEASGGARNFDPQDVKGITVGFKGQEEIVTDVSLKLISPDTKIGQSVVNILKYFDKNKSLLYIIAEKDKSGNRIIFKKIELKGNNIDELFSTLNNSSLLATDAEKEEARNPTTPFLHKITDPRIKKETIPEPKTEFGRLANILLLKGFLIKDVEEKIKKAEIDISGLKKSILQVDKNIKIRKVDIIQQTSDDENVQKMIDNYNLIFNELIELLKEKERLVTNLPNREYKISIDKSKLIRIGEINYSFNDLTNILKTYKKFAFGKVQEIYNELSILNDSVNEFFLDSNNKNVNNKNLAIEKAKSVQNKLEEYVENSQQLEFSF